MDFTGNDALLVSLCVCVCVCVCVRARVHACACVFVIRMVHPCPSFSQVNLTDKFHETWYEHHSTNFKDRSVL